MEAKCPGLKVSGQTTENVEEYQEIIGELTNLFTLQPRETAQRCTQQLMPLVLLFVSDKCDSLGFSL